MRQKLFATATLLGVFLGSFGLAQATSILLTQQGGTGVGAPSGFTAGIVGASGLNNLFTSATTSVSCSGLTSCTSFTAIGASPITISSTGSSGLSTTTPLAASNLLVYSVSGAGSAYGVATSTPTIGSVLTYSGTLGALVGGASGTFGIANLAVTNGMLANSTISGVALGGTLAALTATDSTLTFSGSYTGTTAQTIGINLANPNTWTGKQTINNASSTAFTTGYFYASGNVGIGTTTPFTTLGVAGTITANNINATSTNATSTFSGGLTSTGEQVGQDIANAWSGQITPTHTLIYPAATSTSTWTASSTPGVDAAVPIVATFKGTLRDIYCTSNSFLGVQIKINSTVTTPAYRIASSTANLNALTSNNTFVIGDLITLTFGTTTNATASAPVYANCSIDATQTP